MSYSIEKDWTTVANLRAIALRTERGHLCGYVGVPTGHVLHGKHYTDAIPELLDYVAPTEQGSIGKRGVLSALCMAGGG